MHKVLQFCTHVLEANISVKNRIIGIITRTYQWIWQRFWLRLWWLLWSWVAELLYLFMLRSVCVVVSAKVTGPLHEKSFHAHDAAHLWIKIYGGGMWFNCWLFWSHGQDYFAALVTSVKRVCHVLPLVSLCLIKVLLYSGLKKNFESTFTLHH